MRAAHGIGRENGYSLVELMVALCLVGLMLSMAVIQIGTTRPGIVGDGAMRQLMGVLNRARETAIAQRREVDVAFSGNNRVQIIRDDVGVAETVLADIQFEGGVGYGLVAGIADTPDKFGNSSPISFGAAASIKFNTEGMLVDSGGTPVNGTVFVRIPNQPLSYRAVTILGSTGRVRGFRWNGSTWTRV